MYLWQLHKKLVGFLQYSLWFTLWACKSNTIEISPRPFQSSGAENGTSCRRAQYEMFFYLCAKRSKEIPQSRKREREIQKVDNKTQRAWRYKGAMMPWSALHISACKELRAYWEIIGLFYYSLLSLFMMPIIIFVHVLQTLSANSYACIWCKKKTVSQRYIMMEMTPNDCTV